MIKKEAFVFALLAIGIALSFGGLALVSRGSWEGWIAVALAAPMLFIAQRSMRVASTTTAAPDVVPAPERSE